MQQSGRGSSSSKFVYRNRFEISRPIALASYNCFLDPNDNDAKFNLAAPLNDTPGQTSKMAPHFARHFYGSAAGELGSNRRALAQSEQ